jgi:hypothetical protein
MMNFFRNLFGRRKRIQVKDPKETAANLRSMVLHIKPIELGLNRSDEFPNVWGAIMEIGMSGAVVTVVSLADSTTSIYFSSGGGFIGSGGHPQVSNASKKFIQLAERYLSLVPQAIACPMPPQGSVRFHLLTFDGYRSTEIVESEIENPSHPFHNFYVQGQEIITQVRLKEGK